MKLRRVAILLATAWAAPDALADLKTENPNAYSIVKGLLAKQKLGVLNPMHPSAVLEPEQQATTDGDIALDEYRPTGRDSMAVAADNAAAKLRGKNMLSWKPINDDDAEVTNLLDSVEQMTGKTVSTRVQNLRRGDQEESLPALGAFDWLHAPALRQQLQAPALPKQPKEETSTSRPAFHTGRKNPYLADLGLDSLAAKTAEARAQLDANRLDLAERKPSTAIEKETVVSNADDEEAMLNSALGLETQTPAVERVRVLRATTPRPPADSHRWEAGWEMPAVASSNDVQVEHRHVRKRRSSEQGIKTVDVFANPYLKQLGITKAKVGEEEKTRGPTDNTNPYLLGMGDLSIRKSVSLSSLESHEDTGMAEVEKTKTATKRPRYRSQLNKWLES
eukprot:CAMPEP_0197655544 /NCGR_PEP_ID=MMETSP1338-20131121/39510_1 /TAXON_ID=43686 ORGANISM="Pelagodinium beii, Strain RCC1491" /NCGR_SAMPLE_ID=MMETSP1338 /ASSEMBLY_ACC=CAM_ASM_000754 /LENGTH=391 /DNA_ID=CAMNT_0043231205 /DNA_START=32 /DNA_END=1207 /DNA_ORIENTATION=+